MSIILNRIPSVQGATGLPRMRTQPVGDVQCQPPWSFTPLHSGCTKRPLAAMFTAHWYIAMRVIVHQVYKALRDFPVCVHSLLETYRVRRHIAVQIHTVGVQKLL